MKKSVFFYCLLPILVCTSIFYTACNKDEEPIVETENFVLTYERLPIQPRKDKALILSKQNGEVVHYQFLEDSNTGEPETIVMEVQRAVGEQLALTIIKRWSFNLNGTEAVFFPHLTYTNLPSNAIIQSDILPTERLQLDTVEITIHNINSVEEIRLDTYIRGNVEEIFENNTLTLRYIKEAKQVVFLLLKANNREEYQYFYVDAKVGENRYTLDFEDLKSNLVTRELFLEHTFWNGTIQAARSTGEKMSLYNSQILNGTSPLGVISIWYPKGTEFAEYQVDLTSAQARICKRLNFLPEFLQASFGGVELINIREDGFAFTPTFDFSTNERMEYYIAKYRFRVRDNPSSTYNWTIVGTSENLQSNIQFLLPKIPTEVLDGVEGLGEMIGPDRLQIEGTFTEVSPATDFWSTPSVIFDKKWQLEKGVSSSVIQQGF